MLIATTIESLGRQLVVLPGPGSKNRDT